MAKKEYIERDSVLRSLAVLLQMPFADLDDAWEVAQKTPAADVVEVRHGEWIDRDGKTWCSRCDASNKQYKPPYCPHCGARMDGGKTE